MRAEESGSGQEQQDELQGSDEEAHGTMPDGVEAEEDDKTEVDTDKIVRTLILPNF